MNNNFLTRKYYFYISKLKPDIWTFLTYLQVPMRSKDRQFIVRAQEKERARMFRGQLTPLRPKIQNNRTWEEIA